MSLPFYFDHNVPRAIAAGLQRRGLDVLTSQEDAADRRPDEWLLERATALGRLLVSEDKDFTRITAAWLRSGRDFPGVVRIPRQRLSIGEVLDDLELIATVMTPEEARNRLFYLPIR